MTTGQDQTSGGRHSFRSYRQGIVMARELVMRAAIRSQDNNRPYSIHPRLAAHTYVVVARYVLDLAIWIHWIAESSRIFQCAPGENTSLK
jgi:hypothetical protein